MVGIQCYVSQQGVEVIINYESQNKKRVIKSIRPLTF